jgi:hypothetical protein
MENKKLLKYLLKDLTELNEMFTEEGKTSFDEMEMEFIKNRISGAKRLVKLFVDKDNEENVIISDQIEPIDELADFTPEYDKTSQDEEVENDEEIVVEDVEEKNIQNNNAEIDSNEIIREEPKTQNTINESDAEIPESVAEVESEVPAESEEKEIEKVETIVEERKISNKEMELEEEEMGNQQGKRLGDSFLKEKSVNDSINNDSSKLEHKLSNMPVKSIKSSIGINDKFQYIRELFEGSADDFVKTIDELDAMENIKEAVDYLQTNFKWKKNDTSLKFVNLIKRRFPND